MDNIKDIKKGILIASVLMFGIIISGIILRNEIYKVSGELQTDVADIMAFADFLFWFCILLGGFVISFLLYCWHKESIKNIVIG